MSAGYTHFETDGWRENADQEDNIANVFAQYEFTTKPAFKLNTGTETPRAEIWY